MTDDDITRLREAAQAAKANLWASDDVGEDIDNAYIAAASPDVVKRLISRLEAAERERDEAIREKVLATQANQRLAAERDALAALLRRAFAALTEWHCELGIQPESDAVLLHDIRVEIDIDALAAKEQSNG